MGGLIEVMLHKRHIMNRSTDRNESYTNCFWVCYSFKMRLATLFFLGIIAVFSHPNLVRKLCAKKVFRDNQEIFIIPSERRMLFA